VYYELRDERENSGRTDVAICRVEQLCPFPYDLVQRELKRYPSMELFFLDKMFCFYTIVSLFMCLIMHGFLACLEVL